MLTCKQCGVIIAAIIFLIGYLPLQYVYIPSFELWGIIHIQPPIEVHDIVVSWTFLCFSLTLFVLTQKYVTGRYIYFNILTIYTTWGFLNNFVDEYTGHANDMGFFEKLSFALAILFTVYILWKHRQKSQNTQT
jgi:multisubunit Na+/H+ antiporter MnhF subunit